ncbi:hypothetical protein F0U60_39340 [Archangium minus]|uniref:Lipoprotein n=1 Tax=Archangium minus TaxID=83450 RepID=A0ABY9X293_9BACT|nr:hypothetical protein F0U60_39340 [Archangium minus]
MIKRVVISALAGALMVVSTGCADECVDPFDCLNDEGAPAQGREWACVDNKCEQRDIQPPSGDDAGTDTDAGTETDAGTDAGTETDAGTDAGTMTVDKGGACTASMECMAGLRCEGAAGARTCQPLHIAVTASLDGGSGAIEAVAVLAESGATVIELSQGAGPSRFPRWNTDGTAVAFVEEETAGAAALVSRTISPTAGVGTPLTTAGTAGTEDFRHLEWEPSSSVTWVKKAGTSISGIYAIPSAGGAVEELSPNGGFPSWKNAQTFAFSAKGQGLQTRTIGGAAQAVTGGETGEQPKYNRVNDFLLYLASTESDTFSGGEQQPLYELFTLPATGATATQPASPIARRSEPTPVTAGEVKSFITAHTWSPDGTYVTYVRAFYYDPTLPTAPNVICGGMGAECGTQAGPNVYLQRTNPENGQAVGDPILVATNATLPAVSPDGHFVAYIQGQRLYMRRINPTDWSLGEPAVLTPATMRVQTNLGDDHRPRWQPR